MTQSLKSFLTRVNIYSEGAPNLNRSVFSQQDVPDKFHVQSLKGIELYEVSVENLQRYLTEGRFSSVDYVRFCLERIHCVCNPLFYSPRNVPIHACANTFLD